jgi:glucokinase
MSTASPFPHEHGGAYGLVGDLGGTNARFALADLSRSPPGLVAPRTLPCDQFETVEDAIEAYLGDLGRYRPKSAVIAVAGPVKGGETRLTNGAWRLSERKLASQGFPMARVINDFAALALGAAGLKAQDREKIGRDAPDLPGETIAVIGAGTGFGVGALVFDEGRPVAMTTEGGHSSFAPADDVEVELLQILTRRFGRVSIERILSGPGLQNLYGALAEFYGAPSVAPDPAEITRQALAGEDHCCVETLDRFCAIFGSAAGDIALTLGARGGVYLAGGIAPRIIDHLQKSQFRRRFEAKGRFSAYMRQIPTSVILQPHAALAGAAEQLRRMHAGRSAPTLITG